MRSNKYTQKKDEDETGHQIKNVVNEKYTETPQVKKVVTKNTLSPRRLPTTKRNTSISGKDDRNTFITGKKPEHPEDVEDKAPQRWEVQQSQRSRWGRRKYQ